MFWRNTELGRRGQSDVHEFYLEHLGFRRLSIQKETAKRQLNLRAHESEERGSELWICRSSVNASTSPFKLQGRLKSIKGKTKKKGVVRNQHFVPKEDRPEPGKVGSRARRWQTGRAKGRAPLWRRGQSGGCSWGARTTRWKPLRASVVRTSGLTLVKTISVVHQVNKFLSKYREEMDAITDNSLEKFGCEV